MHVLITRGVLAAIFCVAVAAPVFADPLYTFMPFGSTEPTGINNAGAIVGSFQTTPSQQHGFLDFGGTFSQFDVPGAVSTTLSDINNANQIAGTFFDGTNNVPFILSGGSVVTINVPGTYGGAYASGINDAGKVVGSFNAISTGFAHGFLDAGGTITQIDVPGAFDTTEALGINNAGQIVGFFDTGPGPGSIHGFLDTAGSFTTIEVPGAILTEADGINDAGQITGFFTDSSGHSHGFVDTNGSFETLDVLGSSSTRSFGINDQADLVGDFSINNRANGFVATPVPEPASLALFSTALAGFVALRRRASARQPDR